jgi:hypothetical protein
MMNRRDFLLSSGAAVIAGQVAIASPTSNTDKPIITAIQGKFHTPSVMKDPTADFYFINKGAMGYVFEALTEKIGLLSSSENTFKPMMTRILIRPSNKITTIWSPSFKHAEAAVMAAIPLVDKLVEKGERHLHSTTHRQNIPVAEMVPLPTQNESPKFAIWNFDNILGNRWKAKEIVYTPPKGSWASDMFGEESCVRYVRKAECLIPDGKPVRAIDPEDFRMYDHTGHVEISQGIIFLKNPATPTISPIFRTPVFISDHSRSNRVHIQYRGEEKIWKRMSNKLS